MRNFQAKTVKKFSPDEKKLLRLAKIRIKRRIYKAA
jgi:hypothetical protein